MRVAATLLFCLMLAPVLAGEPLALRDMGSFHIGGRVVEISGRPVQEIVRVPGGPPSRLDPNGRFQVEQMYVQYFLPQNRRGKYPLLLWHGGGLTGASFETTPDGREGWLNMFIRKGWDVYISDAVERGRSGFAGPDIWKGEPVFLNAADPFERFRIGTGQGSYDPDPAKRHVLSGNQFPVEAYDQFMKQVVPRWLSTDDAIVAAYTELVDKVCPCVILFHSQGGAFGFKVAQARPDKVKAIVAVESAGAGQIDRAGALKGTPVLMLFGDNIDKDARWTAYHKTDLDYATAVRATGGSVDVIELPDQGIKGNSHMVIMDRNNAQIADIIQKWLASKGLVD
ncbi:MAG: esterase [Xanthobacteraceae bacterium]|nr:esterase [Xanthobacteraceae bacterium]MBV9627424.1 esterase [Xanthobacteraceae bacterium]